MYPLENDQVLGCDADGHPRSAAKEDMTEGLAAVDCCLRRERKVLDDPALADDIGQSRQGSGPK
jgi:hypothetical protein